MSLNEIIPAAWRKPTYVVYALIGVALGAIATAYGPDNIPEWHAVTTNVVLYVGGAFGLTAAANTIVTRSADSDGAEEIAPDDADDVPLDEDSEYEDEALAAEVDATPAPDGYEPRH
ncbi:hypothetical protein PGC08_14020 [Brevibacterium sp. BDJS002]|uniref:hypothetical protein n=1 Tax=Brevibacterium sp. BDJS002 TaxID=3020906 RepID=UPI0023072F4C|nr:hypothetical protein [Brevibacterium sp. BDJS002]WCE39107.1 hypothetical protein PGC08_14020 [Brevibacterium sp. BDJS002]